MGWLRRFGGGGPDEPGADGDDTDGGAAEVLPVLERASPGLAALFRDLEPDGRHTLLDLGPASARNLEHHARFARRIRFADLLDGAPPGGSWGAALDGIPRYPGYPYDLVLAWNFLDRMGRDERPAVVQAFTRLTAPGARMHLVTDMSGEAAAHPLRFTILAGEQVRQEAVGPRRPTWPTLLPAEVERLLAPFRVEHAFTLRQGLREYVAVRPARPS